MRRLSRTCQPRWIAVALMSVLLAGCIEVNIQSEFNSDGSARHAFEMTMDKASLEQLAAMGGEEAEMFSDLEQAEEEAEAAGMTFEAINTDEKVGMRVSKVVEDSSDIGATFDELFAAGGSEAADVPVGAFAGTFEKDGGDYRLDMMVDSDKLFGGGMDMGDIPMGQAEDFFAVTYTAVFPGEVKETNGEKVADDTVQWELPLSGTTEITAVSSGGGSAGANTLLIALVALLGVGSLAAVGLFLFQRRPKPVPAAPLGAEAGAATVSGFGAAADAFGGNPQPAAADASADAPSAAITPRPAGEPGDGE